MKMNMINTVAFCRKAVLYFAVAAFGFLPVACDSDDLEGDTMYTFTGDTVASFCENTPELSMFYELLMRTETTPLLKVYGHYTCFAPTNEAMQVYLNEKGKDLASMSREDMIKVVYNSIIRGDGRHYMTEEFEKGALGMPSMDDRTITVSFDVSDTGEREIWINNQALIVSPDHELHNGVIHVVNKVLEPAELTFLEVLQTHGDFNIWAAAYEATGWDQGMNDRYDESYVNTFGSDRFHYNYPDWAPFQVPTKLKLGYTLFCEPDELLIANGITDVASMEQYAKTYYGSEDLGNYKSEKNPLNRFIAYHMLNRKLSTSTFIYSGPLTTDSYMNKRYEYYETMYEYHMIEMRAGNKINAQRDGAGAYVGVDEDKSDIQVLNGFIHTLTENILVYDEDVMKNDVLHKRIRFDFFTCAPQFTNNDMRWTLTDLGGTWGGKTCTPDFCGKYFTYNDAGVCLLWASNGWSAYQADEINMKESYDVTVRMLPVPPGTWELRLGYRAENWRGMAQLFVDGNIAGTPVDLKINWDENNKDPRVGWEKDSETADNGIENDKLMRNHGYMKAPASIWLQGTRTLRDFSPALRYIVGRYDWPEYGEHFMRIRTVDFKGREFSCDYLELIPVDLIRNEDRD